MLQRLPRKQSYVNSSVKYEVFRIWDQKSSINIVFFVSGSENHRTQKTHNFDTSNSFATNKFYANSSGKYEFFHIWDRKSSINIVFFYAWERNLSKNIVFFVFGDESRQKRDCALTPHRAGPAHPNGPVSIYICSILHIFHFLRWQTIAMDGSTWAEQEWPNGETM